jgi:integrase
MKRGFGTIRAARDFLNEQEAAKAGGSFVAQAGGRVTVEALAGPWLAHKGAVLKATSAEDLESAWRIHVEPRWAGVRVSQVRKSDVAAWVAGIAAVRSASVTIRAHGVLAGILDVAVADRLIVANPARGVQLPRKARKPRRRYLTADEVEAVATAAGRSHPMYRVIVLVLAYTGLRWGELAALQGWSIDWKRGRIQVSQSASITKRGWVVSSTKGWEARSVPVPQSVLADLRAYAKEMGPEDLLFPPVRGGAYQRPPAVRSADKRRGGKATPRWWEKALLECGLTYMSPHDLRHTAASLAVSAGANVLALQRMLGHKSAALTLDTYSDLLDGDLDEVAERMETRRKQIRDSPTAASS